jgi:ABC-2 type transport system permease protein
LETIPAAEPTAKTRDVRPFYWSVRREIWENRSIYLGPLLFAGFVLLGLCFRLHDLPERRRAALLLEPAKAKGAIEMPYDAAIGMLVVAAFLIGAFYCLDALYGERRERSILFWKSLPVSDLTTVLSKIAIPLVVLPIICMVLSLCVHLMWLLVSSIVLLIGGVSPATTFAHVPLFQLWIAMIYSWLAVVLWHAPIYAWLLLVSSWARKAPFLWAVLPFVAMGIFERVAFGSQYVTSFVRYRVVGWFYQAMVVTPHGTSTADPLADLTPGRFLATPGLWLGLLFAAACLFGAVRLRRYRGPV